MNADDRLPWASFGRVEGGDGIVEGGDGADVRAQPSVPHSLNDLAQLGAIGFDDEVDRQAVGGPRLDRSDDGHERSSGANQARGPLPDAAADEIEHEIDSANVFQDLVVEVDELVRAEVERLLTIGGASGADDVGTAIRASCVTIDPTAPAAPCAMTLCPARRRPCSKSPCHAVSPEIGRLAPTVKSTSPGNGARLRASIATYSARVPSRYQSARPNTRCPTDRPVVPYPRAVTAPASSCPGIDGVRSRSRRSVQVEGHASSVGTNPDAWT